MTVAIDKEVGTCIDMGIVISVGIDIIQVPKFSWNCFHLQDTKIGSSDHCVDKE